MKFNRQLFEFMGIWLVLSAIMVSCIATKKTGIKCPDFQQNKLLIVSASHKRINNEEVRFHCIRSRITRLTIHINGLPSKHQQKNYVTSNNDSEEKNTYISGIGQNNNLNKTEYLKGLSASICDPIAPISGSLAVGRLSEIGTNMVEYRKYNNPNMPVIPMKKSYISPAKINKEVIDHHTSICTAIPVNNSDTRKTERLALTGILSGLAGSCEFGSIYLILFGIPLGLLAIILGVYSLRKIKKQPAKYKGKAFAIASIIMGLIDYLGVVIYIYFAVL